MSLVPRPLTPPDALDLSARLRPADLMDLTVHEQDPYRALRTACDEPGEAYCVWDGDQRLGAGGWTAAGAVWSLWTELSVAQSRELIRMAVPWSRIMAIRSRRPLQNVFLKGNSVTERWLRNTRCVDILDDAIIDWRGRTFVPFYLKPLEDLPYV